MLYRGRDLSCSYQDVYRTRVVREMPDGVPRTEDRHAGDGCGFEVSRESWLVSVGDIFRG